MANLGFYFNENACSGCRACQMACKDRNDLPVGILFRNVTTLQTGTYPNSAMFSYSATCNHCTNAVCVENCPTGACHRQDDGTIAIDQSECIGCQTCVNTCPYGHPQYDEGNNYSLKCDACKPYRDRGMNPICVDACNMRCLDFGDIDELKAKYGSDGLVQELPFLPSSDETAPSLLIDPKEASLSGSYREVII